ncbi:hypothetical protein DXA68_02120 [Bacteroides stercorirosoris]|uniref:Uncharacterized protein n=1 Tax=Bacteroides stercorirosoris TaxID=871324 RepID=A0A413HB68_9BACE|nr:hypothetical protein DXA68_02120 [Bacteroides stercorirosoris]
MLSSTGKLSFHHGDSFFPSWRKEKILTEERISIRMKRTKHPKEKTIRMPKKEVSCRKWCSFRQR